MFTQIKSIIIATVAISSAQASERPFNWKSCLNKNFRPQTTDQNTESDLNFNDCISPITPNTPINFQSYSLPEDQSQVWSIAISHYSNSTNDFGQLPFTKNLKISSPIIPPSNHSSVFIYEISQDDDSMDLVFEAPKTEEEPLLRETPQRLHKLINELLSESQTDKNPKEVAQRLMDKLPLKPKTIITYLFELEQLKHPTVQKHLTLIQGTRKAVYFLNNLPQTKDNMKKF